jgi:hypothetical protein
MSPANFQYKARPQESWEKRASGKLYEGFALDSFQVLNLRDDNNIRILPPTWEDPQHYGIDLWVHFGVGPMNATVICLHRMKGEKCPQCEAWARAQEQGRPDADQLKPTRRVLVWVIDKNEDKGVPFLWAMPQTVDTAIAAICRDRMTGELFQIDHPTVGRDVYFQRKQKGGGTMFVDYMGYQLASRPTQVEDKYLDYVLAHPLPSTLNWRTFQQIENLNLGGVATESVPTPAQASSPTPSQAPAPVQAVPPPPPSPQTFMSEWTDLHCSMCSKLQYTVPQGVTCEGGHINAVSQEEIAATTPPPPTNGGVQAPPPPPGPPVSTGPAIVSRTQALKDRFSTGTMK